jgi:hypothetical protein
MPLIGRHQLTEAHRDRERTVQGCVARESDHANGGCATLSEPIGEDRMSGCDSVSASP